MQLSIYTYWFIIASMLDRRATEHSFLEAQSNIFTNENGNLHANRWVLAWKVLVTWWTVSRAYAPCSTCLNDITHNTHVATRKYVALVLNSWWLCRYSWDGVTDSLGEISAHDHVCHNTWELSEDQWHSAPCFGQRRAIQYCEKLPQMRWVHNVLYKYWVVSEQQQQDSEHVAAPFFLLSVLLLSTAGGILHSTRAENAFWLFWQIDCTPWRWWTMHKQSSCRGSMIIVSSSVYPKMLGCEGSVKESYDWYGQQNACTRVLYLDRLLSSMKWCTIKRDLTVWVQLNEGTRGWKNTWTTGELE